MKKNILMLINGFGIERNGSYSIYSNDLMPNFEAIRSTKIFKPIVNILKIKESIYTFLFKRIHGIF